MSWSTPKDLRHVLLRKWERGELLNARLSGESVFPLDIRLKRPTARDIANRFGQVMDWIQSLREKDRDSIGYGYDLRWMEVRNRVQGSNEIPIAAVFPTESDALRFIGRAREADRIEALANRLLERYHTLKPWVLRYPFKVLSHEGEWDRLLAVLDWFVAHPRSNLYLRQLDIPGVDTKFIENRRSLLMELLDPVLPDSQIDPSATGVANFNRRYGLRSEPVTLRFRLLDPRLYIAGLRDLSAPIDEVAQLNLPVRRAFVTENRINGLAFPDCPESLVIFGLGYGLDRLAEIPWLRRSQIWYWGDIDTHGFGILDQFRAIFPDTHSFLMDRQTLEAHRELWVEEAAAKRYHGEPTRLTDAEYELFDDLRNDVFGERVRLEQERIGYGWLKRALRGCPAE
ncbi:MAG: DUF3322 domain-containing protein [Limnochordia bacterium]|jgi:hypothetical protein